METMWSVSQRGSQVLQDGTMEDMEKPFKYCFKPFLLQKKKLRPNVRILLAYMTSHAHPELGLESWVGDPQGT